MLFLHLLIQCATPTDKMFGCPIAVCMGIIEVACLIRIRLVISCNFEVHVQAFNCHLSCDFDDNLETVLCCIQHLGVVDKSQK